MKRLFLIAGLIAGWMLGIQQSYSVQSTFIVEGIVVDGTTSLPLEGVIVTLIEAPSLPAGPTFSRTQAKAGSADSHGHFSISEVKPGRYRVVPEKTGFVFAVRPGLKTLRDPGAWIQVSPGQPVTEIQMSMVK
ncbi:MAG TPA: carboxypeptidase-like regulatory domain-containing protein, partial [Terriglobia bacterium]|nr:carboxypeptidase-like regulatory domain-containing protein [Terriglobia bacterium]